MKICYFTATGNSLYVARRIGGELLSIPQLMNKDEIRIEDDAVGIVCPVYCGEMPKMVRDFMKKAKIKTDYFFFINTYGMQDTVARQNAVAVSQKVGLKLDYCESILMVDNFLPGFEMKDQIDHVEEKKIEEQIEKVCNAIRNRERNKVDLSFGKRAEMTVVHNTMAKMILTDKAALSYIVNDDCIRCGICARVCPANNIAVGDHVEFSDHCEVCYACLHNCPKNAIHMKSEKSSVRFRNENVTLEDIVAANE